MSVLKLFTILAFVLLVGAGCQKVSEETLGVAPLVFQTSQGGTGTSTEPLYDQILIGGDTAGAYDVKTLIAGSNITITTSSGQISIASTGGGGAGVNDWGRFGTTFGALALRTSSTYPVWLDDNFFVSGTTYLTALEAVSSSTLSGISWTYSSSSATNLTLNRISGSTFSTVQDLQNIFHSAGWVSGGAITNDTDGTITVASGTGLIRATDNDTTDILFFDWAEEAGANVNLADNDISYVYAEYNSGSPRAVAVTTERTDLNTSVLLATISRKGTTLHINEADKTVVGNHALNMILRLKATLPYGHVSGSIISETGTRNIAFTAGEFWRGLTNFNISATDTSGADDFTYFFRDGSGGFTSQSGNKSIDNLSYDDNSGTTTTLSNNKYGVHWVYLEADDDDVAVLYGQGNYTLQEAQDATPPASVPQRLQVEGIIAGKIIIKKSDTTFTQIESLVGATKASGSIATEHGNLVGLGDDDHVQYLLIDGTRDMTGGINPNANNTLNLGSFGAAWGSLFASSTSYLATTIITGDLTVDTNTLYVDSANNRVGIGTLSPASALDIRAATAGSARFTNTTASSPTTGAFVNVISDDGAAMSNGHRLGGFLFGGNKDGTNLGFGGGLVGFADGNWTASSLPTKFVFEVAPAGSTSRVAALTIQSDADILLSDNLLFGSGAVINFNSSDVTITHSTNLLTVGGGTLSLEENLFFPDNDSLITYAEDGSNQATSVNYPVVKPNTGNFNGSLGIRPSGTATESSLTLESNSTRAVGNALFGIGGGFAGAVSGSWNFGSFVNQLVNVDSRPISFTVSNVADGRFETMRMYASGLIDVFNELGVSSTLKVAGDVTFQSNLLFDSGSVISFNAGDILFTHSANDISITGGSLTVEKFIAPVSANPTIDTAGDLAIDTTSNQFKYTGDGSTVEVLTAFRYVGFNFTSSTWGSGTTTLYLAPADVGETWSHVKCETDTGTLNVSYYDGTNRMDMLNASSTIGTFTFSTNNTFTASESRRVDFGTAASSPTSLACKSAYRITAD